MRSVLAVGAHPDDIELGCAATLAAHRAAGDRVSMLVMTGGQNGPGDSRVRRIEQENAAAALDAQLYWGGLVDCAVPSDASTVAVVEHVIAEVGADVIYVHHDQDSHQDHRAVAAATVSAARQRCRVLHYQSPSTIGFTPTVFTDIGAFLDAKLAALACHASQVEGSAMVAPDVVAASARHYGAQARVQFAEAFTVTRFVWDLSPVATSDGMLGALERQLAAPSGESSTTLGGPAGPPVRT